MKIIRLLFILSAIGMGYVSYKLHSEDNYSTASEKIKILLSENKIKVEGKNELIKDLENEIQKVEERNRVVYILDATILVFITGLYFLTPKKEN
ncbi:hypothetical protein [Cellulophaga fucicola]|uniref:Uncharacterized protein n=1 Tax=Cellulophaga fucicola TaxID=76595 RepID=A0A1K1QN84_9FLAO|nr:hypothetical protein [Cellulophaga fucicola]SFW61229.1 hypothetical protein SAMN05660313_02813 [Cellulophaga fucicola]